MEIKLLNNETYKGKKLIFRYKTEFYYDIEAVEDNNGFYFSLIKKKYDEIIEKQFEDTLLSDWLEKPKLFGVVEKEDVVGYLELSHEQWNNRMRISNILVEESHRGQGIGKALMKKACSIAIQENAIMIVLETQSCNYNAISFYRSCGFSIIGFDLFAYTNQDVNKREFRIEMAKQIDFIK